MRVALAVVFAALAVSCGASEDEVPAAAVKGEVDAAQAEVVRPEAPPAKSAAAALELADAVVAFTPTTPADYVGKHVLVAHGATLRVAPNASASAAVVHLAAVESEIAGRAMPLALTMEVVGADGEYLAVRSALERNRCTGAMPQLADFDIKLWVKPAALAPVLAVRTELRGAGGDSAELWPGVPVQSDGGDAVADVGGLTINAPLAVSKISSAFEPEPPPTLPGEIVALQSGPTVTWSGVALDESVLARVERGGQVAAVVEDSSGARPATVWTRCARLTGKVAGSRSTHPPAPDAGEPHFPPLVPIVAVAGDAWELVGSSTVFAQDGTKLGVTTATTRFSVPPREHKGRSCFAVKLAGPRAQGSAPETSNLELCFESSAVTARPDPLRAKSVVRILGVYGGPSAGMHELFGSSAGDLDSAFDSAVGGSLLETDPGMELGGIGGVTASARVRVKRVTLSGGGDADAAKRVVGRHRGAVRSCYEALLERKEGASGGLKLHLSLAASGRVAAVSASDDSVGGEVAKCIQKAAAGWRFAAAPGATKLVASLVFSSM